MASHFGFVFLLSCTLMESDAYTSLSPHRLFFNQGAPQTHNCHWTQHTKIRNCDSFCRVSRRCSLASAQRSLRMSTLGPIGPFNPFRSTYCSSGIVEREMAELTALAQTLSTKFARMMLEFQVPVCPLNTKFSLPS